MPRSVGRALGLCCGVPPDFQGAPGVRHKPSEISVLRDHCSLWRGTLLLQAAAGFCGGGGSEAREQALVKGHACANTGGSLRASHTKEQRRGAGQPGRRREDQADPLQDTHGVSSGLCVTTQEQALTIFHLKCLIFCQ